MFARIVEFIPKKEEFVKVGIRPRRFLAMAATLFGAMVLTLPAFGQQDMDPTWFNPWDAPKTAVAQSSRPRVAIHHQPRTVKHVSAAPVRRGTSRQAARKPAKVVIARSLRQQEVRQSSK